MGILKGALSGRRYIVDGELPEGWRGPFGDALGQNAFPEAVAPTRKDEVFGWVQIHNLLDTRFDAPGQWLYNHYAVFALRVDKKVLPAKLFKAHLDKRLEAWCAQNNRDRCPPTIRNEVKEALELEMLTQTLPRVQVYELAWNVHDRWLFFHNDAELPNERLRKHFLRTFGLRLVPWLPIDELGATPELVEALLAAGVSDLRAGEEA